MLRLTSMASFFFTAFNKFVRTQNLRVRTNFCPFCSANFCSVPFCSVPFCSVHFCSVPFCSVPFCSAPFCSSTFCSAPFLFFDLFVLSPYCPRPFCRAQMSWIGYFCRTQDLSSMKAECLRNFIC